MNPALVVNPSIQLAAGPPVVTRWLDLWTRKLLRRTLIQTGKLAAPQADGSRNLPLAV